MSNSIDFDQAMISDLAIPACRLCVFINGELSGDYEVIEVVRDSGDNYSCAKLEWNLDGCVRGLAGNKNKSPEMGLRVDIVRVFDKGEIISSPGREIIFSGQIEGVIERDSFVEVTARDISARLDRIMISGRRFDDGQCGRRFENSRLIFNEDGKGNASRSEIIRNGLKSNIFANEESGAYWSCGAACMYLLCEYLSVSDLSIPPVELIDSVMGQSICDEIDVEGDSLLSALEKICQQIGVSFKFIPSGQISGQRIVFYRNGQLPEVELDIQRTGKVLNLSQSQLTVVKRSSEFWPVTHRYLAKGEKKVFESTFELIKAWDPSLEGKTVEEYSTDHESFNSVCDVYRKWCLNEAGDYSGLPFNQGEAFSLSDIFDGAEFLPGNRKFIDTVSLDNHGMSYGVYVEVSFDNGDSWSEFSGFFDNLDDQCGIRVEDDRLDEDYFDAADGDTLKIRVTASVESDERLMCSVADGPVNSSIEVIDHSVEPDGTYEYRKVNGRSVFYYDGAGIDESEKLLGELRRIANRDINIIETIEAETALVRTNIDVGQKVVSSVDGRDVIGARGDNRSVFWVDRVVMDFVNQTTKLNIFRKRKFDV